MKLNISAKEFIALYTVLSARITTVVDSDNEPLKQLRDRMKAFLIGSLTRPDESDDPKLTAWKEWEETQKKKIEELKVVEEPQNTTTIKVPISKEYKLDTGSDFSNMLIVPHEEFDQPGTSQYPRKHPPSPTMPKHSGKSHGKRR